MQRKMLIGVWRLAPDRASGRFIFRGEGRCVYQCSPSTKDAFEGKWYLRGSQHLIVQLQIPGSRGRSHNPNGYLETTTYKFLVEQKDRLTVLTVEDPAGFAYDPQVWTRQR